MLRHYSFVKWPPWLHKESTTRLLVEQLDLTSHGKHQSSLLALSEGNSRLLLSQRSMNAKNVSMSTYAQRHILFTKRCLLSCLCLVVIKPRDHFIIPNDTQAFLGRHLCGWANILMLSRLLNTITYIVNTLRPRQNGRPSADDIFKCIFLNENVWILLKISLTFVPKSPMNNIPTLV